MTATDREPVAETLDRLGACLELIPIDPYGDDISVGFFEKDGVITVWSFSLRPGTPERLAQIRDRAVALADLASIDGQPTQFRFPGGRIYRRPLKFLARQAVEKSPDNPVPTGRVQVKDLKSDMILFAAPAEGRGRSQHLLLPQLLAARSGRGARHRGDTARVQVVELPTRQPLDGVPRLPLPPHPPE